MKSFGTAFNQADILILTDIYSAGEKPIPGVTSEALIREIESSGHEDVYFEPKMENIPALIQKIVQPHDMIIVMGAGSIYRIIPDIIKSLKGKA